MSKNHCFKFALKKSRNNIICILQEHPKTILMETPTLWCLGIGDAQYEKMWYP